MGLEEDDSMSGFEVVVCAVFALLVVVVCGWRGVVRGYRDGRRKRED